MKMAIKRGITKRMNLNKTQNTAYELIQSDARFLYSLMEVARTEKQFDSNYIMMCQPYIGVFTDGAEQWCRKVGLKGPQFNNSEKRYYTSLRQSHKLLERPYEEYARILTEKLKESDNYFYSIRGPFERLLGYYNVGTDLCNGYYCGNTLLCSAYLPFGYLGEPDAGIKIRDLSVIAGRIAAFFDCNQLPIYKYNKNNKVEYKDFHFYRNCPLKERTPLGLVLFSILCSINYITVFIDNLFVEEIPQKFKFAYLQYFYICDLIDEINRVKGLNLILSKSMKNRDLRNCFSHYGLGQYLKNEDIVSTDILKGLTIKAFQMEYYEAKDCIFSYLDQLRDQIQDLILL